MQSWNRIPEEMRQLPQWCISGPSKAPMNGKRQLISVCEPSSWMRFDEACYWATMFSCDIGFVLNENDPFICIDLDVKDCENAPDKPDLWTTPEQMDTFYRILQTFDSYAEASRSGKGLHIWVKGSLEKGYKRDGVELYSHSRYMICTGSVVNNQTIKESQTIINNMIQQMNVVSKFDALIEEPQIDDDWFILKTAYEAANSDKFCELFQGHWMKMGYPSQSEADLALLSMFTFYSPSNEQCRRLFRLSGLGKREKAIKNDRYLNETLTVIRTRERGEKSVEMQVLVQSAQLRSTLIQNELQRMQSGLSQANRVIQCNAAQEQTVDTPMAIAATLTGPVSESVVKAGKEGIPWPPGFAGKLAQFIYQSSPRPIKEVSIVATLGFLAGLCGRSFHIPQSGLNLYIILVARSGVGKEAMHTGIANVVRACAERNPKIVDFVDFSDFASGPALTKACMLKPSFVNISGEFGRKLKRLAVDDRENPLTTLRTQMTALYQKSGPQGVMGGITYSRADQNVSSISGVAYSMIGETTPSTFYDSLTSSMMEDGFLSRFLIVEYNGDRPALNQSQMIIPDSSMVDVLLQLVTRAEMPSQLVMRSEEAANLITSFELQCDNSINDAGEDETMRQMWNRAALKVARIAALLAVADHYTHPVIQLNHVKWALDVVNRDINMMTHKILNGDIGVDDLSRERKLLSLLKEYATKPMPSFSGLTRQMHTSMIIQRSYIKNRLARLSTFSNYRLGANAAIESAIRDAILNGHLIEMDKGILARNFNFIGQAYRIISVQK